MSERHKAHWSELAERGTGLGLRFIFVCLHLLGRRITHLMLYPIVLYFFLTAKTARKASHDYLLHLKNTRRPDLDLNWKTGFRHFLAFAESGLDKLIAWSGKLDPRGIAFPNTADFDALRASGQGAVLIGAHLGNLEMTRALASDRRIDNITAIMLTTNAERFTRILAHANAEFGAKLIQVSDLGPDTAILLKEKVEQGELLFIVGDRTPPTDNGRTTDIEFLGQPAPFAVGPWILASLLDCPVYLFFCMPKQAGNADGGYVIHFEHFAERIELPRKTRQEALQAYVQRYADRLADYCADAPLQWFNFFDFWDRSRKSRFSHPAAQPDAQSDIQR